MTEKSKPASAKPPSKPEKAEKPPASAENFEHVLRRLISERDRSGSQVSDSERLG